MPGSKGVSRQKPNPTGGGGPAYQQSANRMGGADTPNIQGFNSMDGSRNIRGGAITNSDGQYGKGKGGGGMTRKSDY